ncbi:MAG: flippase-like domain-containing protein [Pseudomonadales bacterium]|nr:flippase-like domain-containing protein [Pseudomonadales bacterium]
MSDTRIDSPSQTSSSREENQGSGTRLLLFSALFLGLTALGLYTIWDRFAGRSITFDDRLLSPISLIAITGLVLLYFLMDGLRLHFTLRALGHRLPMAALFKLVFINLFFSNVTPMATGGGVAQVVYLRQHGIPLGRATAATTIRTVLAVAVIFTLAPLFLMWLPALQSFSLNQQLGTALAVFAAIYLTFFALVLFRTRWLLVPLQAMLAGLHRAHALGDDRYRRWRFRLKRELIRFAHSFRAYLAGPRRWVALSVLCTVGFLLCLFSLPAVLLAALDYQIPYLTTLGLMTVTTFVMYFAPTPGASGISEGVFGTFFRDLLAGQHLVLVTVAWRFLTIYLGMLIGLILLQRDLARQSKDTKTP